MLIVNNLQGSNLTIVIIGCIVHSNVGAGTSLYTTVCTTGTCMSNNYTIIIHNTVFIIFNKKNGILIIQQVLSMSIPNIRFDTN